MNKRRYPAILVVEGATDQALLESFLDADIVLTNGSEVSRETIEYLQEASKTRDIVVLTDPDSPGKRIRDILDQKIPGLLHAFVRKEKSIKGHKVGVAESSREEIELALANVVPSKKDAQGGLAMPDLYDLGLMGSPRSEEKRAILESALHLGHCNGKTLLKRLNALGVRKETIEEALRNGSR